ncbi:SAR2788 family putative toxin [Arcanobacterium canis]
MTRKVLWKTLTGAVVAIALSISTTGIASATDTTNEVETYSGEEISQAQQSLGITDDGIKESVSEEVDDVFVSNALNDPSVEKITVVDVEQVDGGATVVLHDDGLINVEVSAVLDGDELSDSLDVVSLTVLNEDSGDYVAELRSRATGELLTINTTLAEAQAFPVLVVLGAVARVGLKVAIKQYTKTQIKKAAKSYLLNTLNSNGWKHIMQAKHNWNLVGAKSREQIAEIVGNAMANGTHKAYKYHVEVTYWYKGKKVIVRYAKSGGKVSDAWVVK